MVAHGAFMGYCGSMFKGIKIFASDKYWNHIFADLGADIVDSENVADIVFDDVDINAPVSIPDLQNLIFSLQNNTDIIQKIFGTDVSLSVLQRKIIVLLYKNPNMTMRELKDALGLAPDIATHAVENAIYQLRKVYGREFIENIDGGYKIGHL